MIEENQSNSHVFWDVIFSYLLVCNKGEGEPLGISCEYYCNVVSRNIVPLADKSCSSSLNGSNLEQMSNKECQTLPRSI